jgi:integrase
MKKTSNSNKSSNEKLPNNCSIDGFKIAPADLSMNKRWFVYYTFYDPEYPNGFRRQIRGGINRFKNFKVRKEAAEELMKHEMAELLDGFNPFKRKLIVPANSDVTPDTPFIQALQIAFKKIKGVKGTLVDIQSVIKGTAEAAEKLGIDQMPVKNVSRKYFKMIFEQCKYNPRFSANRQNVYRKWLKKLYDELIEMEAVEVNPLVFIRKEKIVKKKRVMPTDDQREQISKYLKENYYNFWRAIQIFFASGSRETELMNVKIKDIDLKNQQCKYLVLKGKEAHEVTRPISDAVLELWQELVAESSDKEDYLFSYRLTPGPNKLSTEALSKRWKRHVKGSVKSRSKYGKKFKSVLEINVDLYALKYLNTTEIMEILDDTKEAMKLTAHTTEAMIVKIYDTKNKQRKDDKIKKVGSTF